MNKYLSVFRNSLETCQLVLSGAPKKVLASSSLCQNCSRHFSSTSPVSSSIFTKSYNRGNNSFFGFQESLISKRWLRTPSIVSVAAQPQHKEDTRVSEQEVIPPYDNSEDVKESRDVLERVNSQIQGQEHGRLFAVIWVAGKQFKVTSEDIIIVQGFWPPQIGDRVRFEKVLLVGASDFSLVGRPLVSRNVARVEGTVIEKTLSYTKLHFILKKRKNYRRLKFFKDNYSMVRINSIQLEPIPQRQTMDNMDHLVF